MSLNGPPTYEEALKITLETLDSTLWVCAYESDPSKQVELSETDPQYFEVVRLIVGRMVIEEQPLPEPYRKWLYAFLYDGVRPPKRAVGRRSAPEKIEMVVSLVSDLVALGMQATKNEASNHKNTACDVVADALASLGKEPKSYERVKRIWLKNKDNSEFNPVDH